MNRDELPAGWARVTLSDVTSPTRPRADPQSIPDAPFIGMEHVEAHSMRLLGTVPARTMRSAGVLFEKGDVLYGRLRPYLNKVYPAAVGGICSAEFIVLPGGPVLDAGFLAFRLNAVDFVEFAARLNEGDRPRVDFGQIGAFELMLPPLAEQRRIVTALEEYLSDLDAAVAGLARARERLNALFAASLEAAVRGGLTSSPEIGSGAVSYTWEPLRSLIVDISQGWSPKCHPDPPVNDQDWGIIKTTAIQPARYDAHESKALPSEFSPRPELEIRVGDLLVTRKGPRTRAGVAAAVRETRPRLMICDTVYRIRLKAELARPHFMAIAMSSPSVAAAIDAAKAGISESGVSLTHDRLGAIAVPLPPLGEQQRIEAEIDRRAEAIERARTDIDLQLARAARLRQSILQRAFSGRLVPQNPAEEPAELLVERLREKKNASRCEG